MDCTDKSQGSKVSWPLQLYAVSGTATHCPLLPRVSRSWCSVVFVSLYGIIEFYCLRFCNVCTVNYLARRESQIMKHFFICQTSSEGNLPFLVEKPLHKQANKMQHLLTIYGNQSESAIGCKRRSGCKLPPVCKNTRKIASKISIRENANCMRCLSQLRKIILLIKFLVRHFWNALLRH